MYLPPIWESMVKVGHCNRMEKCWTCNHSTTWFSQTVSSTSTPTTMQSLTAIKTLEILLPKHPGDFNVCWLIPQLPFPRHASYWRCGSGRCGDDGLHGQGCNSHRVSTREIVYRVMETLNRYTRPENLAWSHTVFIKYSLCIKHRFMKPLFSSSIENTVSFLSVHPPYSHPIFEK